MIDICCLTTEEKNWGRIAVIVIIIKVTWQTHGTLLSQGQRVIRLPKDERIR